MREEAYPSRLTAAAGHSEWAAHHGIVKENGKGSTFSTGDLSKTYPCG